MRRGAAAEGGGRMKTGTNAAVVWRPQPRQMEFMRRPEPEALYGGAAGGGKSDALVIEALRQVDIPHYRALILRKTFPQLSDLVDKSQLYYRRAFPEAQYNATSHVWVFPSGAKIYFGSMQHTKDRTNYQGKAFDFIGFDELTHFEWEEYSYMMSRNRPTGPGTRVYLRATTNPGGVGHGWVKARFITPAPPGTPIVEEYPIRMPDGSEKRLKRARVFIPSSIFDNPALLENDPDYLASLASLPEAEKQALLYGSWDSFSGQVFTEWRNDPGHYFDQRWTHVIEPFPIPKHWKIYRGYDFGFSKPFSVGWYAVDEEGRLYRIKELYGCTGRPNELRQIGVRDETKIRGGIGICGRPLCCHTYLSEFAAVSIKMAKEQNLSLNPTKISGVCGRLMCCLTNEEETYEELNSQLPSVGDTVTTSDGLTGTVHSLSVLRKLVKVVVNLENDEKEIREYQAEELKFRPRKRKAKVSKEEMRKLAELEKGEGASRLDDK